MGLLHKSFISYSFFNLRTDHVNIFQVKIPSTFPRGRHALYRLGEKLDVGEGRGGLLMKKKDHSLENGEDSPELQKPLVNCMILNYAHIQGRKPRRGCRVKNIDFLYCGTDI